MKKIDLKNLDNRSKKIIAISATAVIALGLVVGGVTIYNRVNHVNPLTSQLGVKDAVKKGDSVEAPYGVSKESFEKAIKEDSYLTGKYNISDGYIEDITAEDLVNFYSVRREYNISGALKVEPKNDAKAITKESTDAEIKEAIKNNAKETFKANIIAHDDFANPSSLSLTYGYANDTELANITTSAKGIVGKLFNKDIATYIFSKTDEAYTTNVDSKSGKYKLTVTKATEKFKNVKELTINIDFNAVAPEKYNLESFKYGKEITPVYAKLGIFNGVEIKDMAKKYSDLIGDYDATNIMSLLNTSKKSSSYTEDMSAFTITTGYKDGTQTAVDFIIKATSDTSGKINKGILNMNTSTRYRKTAEEALRDAVRIVNSSIGTKIEITAEDSKAGVVDRTLKQNICGFDFNITVNIKTGSDKDGFYGVVQVSGQ